MPAFPGELCQGCQYHRVLPGGRYRSIGDHLSPGYRRGLPGCLSAGTLSVDALVAEVRRRALDGVSEPTGWYKGEPGGYVQRYSDNLLMFAVKKEIPEYRDRWEVTGAGGQPIQVLVANYAAPDPVKKPELKTVPAIEGTTTDV